MKKLKKITIFLLCICLLSNFSMLNVEAKSKIKLNKTKVTLSVGKSTTLKLEEGKVKKWSTSNKKIATVSSKGKVTGKKKGTAIITAKTINDISYKCIVTVKKVTPEPEQPSSTYSDSEVMSIVESTLRGAGFVKTIEYMTAEELEEWGPTAGCGWAEFNVSNINPQSDASEISDFYSTNGCKIYYLEKVGSVSGGITIRAYYG